jgi:hypothetical protein
MPGETRWLQPLVWTRRSHYKCSPAAPTLRLGSRCAVAASRGDGRKRAPPKSGEPTMLHFNKINLCGIILFLTGNDTQKFGDGLMKATDATLVLPMRIRPLSRRRAKPRL